MNTQYKIPAKKVEWYGSRRISCSTFNAETWCTSGWYERNLKGLKVGDVIIEVVGIVRERPKKETRIVPFVVGDECVAGNGITWKLIGVLPDRLVWSRHNDPGTGLFTKLDGSTWRDGYTGFAPKMEEIIVGTEKYLAKE